MSPDPDVPFDEIADRLLGMLAEVMTLEGVSPDVLPLGDAVGEGAGRLVVRRVGTFGELDAELATPLALVLNELARTPSSTAWPVGRDAEVRPERLEGELVVAVEDDGVGLPHGLRRRGLGPVSGLQIARTLLADLGGSVELGPREGGGTRGVVGFRCADRASPELSAVRRGNTPRRGWSDEAPLPCGRGRGRCDA